MNKNKFDFFAFFEKLVPKPFKPLYNKIGREKFLYLFFGALTTLVSLASFKICIEIIGEDQKGFSLIANTVSFILAVSFAFIVNRRYVFESNSVGKAAFKETLEFFGMRLITYFLDMAILEVLVERGGWNAMIVKVATQVLILILNYLFSKLVIFRKK